MSRYILFDFDGTLVDSFYCVINQAMLLAEEYNFHRIEAHEIEGLRDLSSRELIKHMRIPFYNIPGFVSTIRKHLYREIHQLKPVDTIPHVLQQLVDQQFVLGILTSNSNENVLRWLETHKLRSYFQFIHNEPFFYSKRSLIKKTLKKYKIPMGKAVYIGDETRDIESAKQNKIASVAVTWGYNSEKALVAYQPEFIVSKPQEIINIAHTYFL